jgi:hypothetical protein
LNQFFQDSLRLQARHLASRPGTSLSLLEEAVAELEIVEEDAVSRVQPTAA